MAKEKTKAATEIALTSKQVSEHIVFIRGVQVILDSEIAQLYGVETRRLNEQVRRNQERFPEHFRFQLSESEWDTLRSQPVTLSLEPALRSQNATSTSSHGGRRYLPYAFTEQGVSMLSAVLRSDTAVQVSIRIMEAFVQMRRYFLQNAELFQEIDQVETRQLRHIADSDEKFNRIFNALDERASEAPRQGIFYNGQIFDAYTFAADIIRGAKKSLYLIDNYVDDAVSTLLSKREPKVAATIYTRKTTKAFQLDLDKHNAQYSAIALRVLSGFHDRFLLVDDRELYHLGASLKDLGKQCFAFSRMDDFAHELRQKLK